MNKAEKIICKCEKLAHEWASKVTNGGSGEHFAAARVNYLNGSLVAEIRTLCAELAEYEPRATGKREHETTYAHDGGELVVHFDCEEGEPMTRDDPGCDPSVTVNAVFANGMNITYLLEGTDVMERIESHCYEAAERAFIESEEDAAISRWESRRDDSLIGAA